MEIIEQAPKRAIVVTPHPDDCEGGCGGTMAKFSNQGANIHLMTFTDGVNARKEKNSKNRKKRSFKYILKESIKIGIYKKNNFTKNPQEYCGVKITDSPLD